MFISTASKYRVLVSLVAVFILLGTIASGIAIYSLRSDAIDNASGDARNIAVVLSEQTVSSVQSIDIILQDLQERLNALGVKSPQDFQTVVGSEAIHRLLVERLLRLSQAEVISLVDRDGQIVNFTREWPIPPIDLTSRDYFQAAETANDGSLYVSAPVANKFTGASTIYFSRRISGANAEFLGLALVGVNLDYFRNVYGSIAPLHDQSFLFLRSDGVVLLRYPDPNNLSGAKMPTSSPWYQMVARGGGNYRSTGVFDHAIRLVAVQPLRGYPLVVNVSVSEASALAKWRRRALTIGTGAAVTLLCLGLLLKMLVSQFASLIRSENSLARRSRELEGANVKVDVAMNNMSQGICMFDAQKRLVVSNDIYARMYRLPSDLLEPGTLHSDIMAYRVRNGIFEGGEGEDVVSRQLSALSALPTDKRSVRTDAHADGKLVRVIREPLAAGGWVATHEDVTEQRHGEQELEQTKQFLDSIIENIPIAVVVKDVKTRRFVLVNRKFAAMLGLPASELLGRTVFDFNGEKQATFIDDADTETIRGGDGINYSEYVMQSRKSGPRVHATKRIVVRDEGGHTKYLVAVIEDITERKSTEQRIAFMAHHDALTGLANRTALAQKIEESAARQRRRGEPFAILLLDLDRFKQVNDTLGHSAGDSLLRDVGTRLQTLLRETDVVARVGGDEFAIIQMGDINQRDAASALADRIIKMISEPFDIEGNEVSIGASIGISLSPEHATSREDLLKMADLALYRAKSAGRDEYRFFDSTMSESASVRHEMESNLRHAIENKEMELHYQPIIDTKTRRVCGAEALIRWRHPTKGMIPPDQFIPLAEETGLISQIGEWVLRTACVEAAGWPPHVRVSVNLSPAQFRRTNLLALVSGVLAESGLPPERLEFEITETALLESAADCLPALRHFKSLGIAIALDDFCTGYSSLSQLTIFPFDKIKIDKSFIGQMTERADCAAIISATLALAQSLNIATTAEGVETAEQYHSLRLAGVTSLQGYLFKRPGPASEIDFHGLYGGLTVEEAA